MLKKLLFPATAIGAVILLSASPAFAFHCFVVNRSEQGMISIGAHSKVWGSATLAEILAAPDPEGWGLCPAKVDAAVAAVEEAGLPTVLATRIDKVLLSGTGAAENGRTGDGKGIDYFEESPFVGAIFGTAEAAANEVTCT